MNSKEQDTSFSGKKIFFLFPPSVFIQEVIVPLSEQEYEVYILSDVNKARAAFRQFKDAICFANIDTGLSDEAWRDFLTTVRRDKSTSSTVFGIITTNTNEDSKKKIIDSYKPECGIISPRSSGEASFKELMAVLEKHQAKGMRKYVRAFCQDDPLARINFIVEDSHVVMRIRDISSVGLCCYTNEKLPVQVKKNMVLREAQLSLRGTLITCNIIVFGENKEGLNSTFVLLFAKDFDNASRFKVRSYIRQFLQSQIDSLK